MTLAAVPERPARPQIEFSRGELGLLVWGLGLLAGQFEREDGTDLIEKDLERLIWRVRGHADELDDWHERPAPAPGGDDSPF